jgi:hypothetical protein
MLPTKDRVRDPHRKLIALTATCPACAGQSSIFCLYEDRSHPQKIFVHPPGGERRQPREFADTVPEALKRAYASTVQSLGDGNYVATAVGSRRTLEGIFKYALPAGQKFQGLANAIKTVTETKDLTAPLRMLSHAIRQGGNLGAHFDEEREPTAEQAQQMVDLLEYLIDYLYTLPENISRLERALSVTPEESAATEETNGVADEIE